ncbi:MAG TPA: heme-binding protein [Dongiaceae bacterium]|nr:heme-binding protein [Dongiaceae bacterium]
MGATVSSRRLTAQAATAAVQAAVDQARALGVAINAAVVDAGGNLIAFLRDDGAFTASVAIAQDKARTAAGFAMPSRTLYDAIKGEPDVLNGIANRPGIAAFPGGLPIRDQGCLVGAIGVSGASAEQDETCAQAGIAALGLGLQ